MVKSQQGNGSLASGQRQTSKSGSAFRTVVICCPQRGIIKCACCINKRRLDGATNKVTKMPDFPEDNTSSSRMSVNLVCQHRLMIDANANTSSTHLTRHVPSRCAYYIISEVCPTQGLRVFTSLNCSSEIRSSSGPAVSATADRNSPMTSAVFIVKYDLG